MAKAVQKIKLSPSRDIPFDKLVLSQSNVRRIKAGISIEDLAEDIARRKLLQSLNVRPILDADGQDTGMFEVPAGGRRYRALELLVKQKRLAKTATVPCIVNEAGGEISAEEDSLAENVHRVALHPLDQFRAFQTLREQGRSEEEIAAIFFVSVNVVKQRLRLAAVSPKLLDVYAEDGMSLEQLMAFSVTADHARQEQVWEVESFEGWLFATPLAPLRANMRERRRVFALAVRIDPHLADGGLGLVEIGGEPALAGPEVVGGRPEHEIAVRFHVRIVGSKDEIPAALLLVGTQGSGVGDRTPRGRAPMSRIRSGAF